VTDGVIADGGAAVCAEETSNIHTSTKSNPTAVLQNFIASMPYLLESGAPSPCCA